MPIVNPKDYLKKRSKNQFEDPEPEPEFVASAIDLNKQPHTIEESYEEESPYDLYEQPSTGEEIDAAGQYNGYENDALNYSNNLFKDDTLESVMAFLSRMRLTVNVRNKFAELYTIAASQDNVLTWSNAWLLQRRANMFKVQVLEFKNTLLGPDADSLLFGDYDLVIEIMAARLESRNGRSFEGFERKAGISNYQYSQTNDVSQQPDTTQRENRSGLSKLGKFNPFKGN